MNSFLFIILSVLFFWIVFNAIYTKIYCRYAHDKIKYNLFGLRDRLRSIRIDHPSFDDHIFQMMELRINGSIGLVSEASLHRVVFAVLFKSFVSEDERKTATEMREAVDRWIKVNRTTELGKQLADIEEQSDRAFVDSFFCNSPIFAYVIVPVVRFIAKHWPKIAKGYKRTRDGIEKETIPVMTVRAARQFNFRHSTILSLSGTH